MSNILVILFIVFYFGNAMYPTGNQEPVEISVRKQEQTGKIKMATGSSTIEPSVPIDCSVNGLFCVMDGQHDYEYYECSSDFKGFRQCAPGTKCKGEQSEPYTYNPCVEYSNTTTSSDKPMESSSTPVTPSVGTPNITSSSDKPVESSTKPMSSSQQQSNGEYHPIDCSVNGLFCVVDGEHDYEYYECSADFKGFRPCAPGTKCKGEQNEPYSYNPCVIDPNASNQPTESSTKPMESSIPTTPSVGTSSTQSPTESSTKPSQSSQQPSGDYNPMECKVNGLFCIIDGEHDYQYYECSSDFKGFRQCAQGTKCKGEQSEPYTYNPCVIDPRQTPNESSTKPTSSEGPVTPSVGTSSTQTPVESNTSQVIPSGDYNPMECKINGLFCIIDGVHDYQYYECSADFKGFRQCAPGTKCKGEQSEPYSYNPCVIDPNASNQLTESSTKPMESSIPTTPSVGTSSTQSPTESSPKPSQSSQQQQPSGDYNPMECKINGLFCIIDGEHDYQYYECSSDFKGFRQCAPSTKCKGEQNEPYSYNPCIEYSNTTSSEKPMESSSPVTPSVGTTSSHTPTESSTKPMSSSQQQPSGDYNPMDCKINGLFCIIDGVHDYQYYECSADFKGFRQCAPGTKCKGEQEYPYSYNPCVTDPNASYQIQTSSDEPVTPSVGTPNITSSIDKPVESITKSNASSSSVPTDCSVDGFFCVMDGEHDYQYLECSIGYQGFRPCAPGTKCRGEEFNPYTYNPCATYTPYNPPTEPDTPTTPSVGTSSTQSQVIPSGDYNPMECKVNGLFCIIDGEHDYQYYECSSDFKGFRQCAPGTKCKGEQSEPYSYNPCVTDPRQTPGESSTKPTSSDTPVTPSVGTSSTQTPTESNTSQVIPSGDYNPMECKINGLFCIIDGVHDYQYYECSAGYKGFRQCAPGTKCKGEQSEPYTYNPCIEYSNTTTSSEKPIESSTPTTPSVGTSSSHTPTESSTKPSQSSQQPSGEYNPMECKEEGFFCVMDGNHNYEYLECSAGYKGFRPCAPGTKCAGEQDEPYKFNPCVMIDPRETPTDSTTPKSSESSTTPSTPSEGPTTPSVGTPSSEKPRESEEQEDIMSCGDFECPEDGLYCQIDGIRNNRYCECATTFKGSRPCAVGTWCNGEQNDPYSYNPCVFIDQTTWFGKEIHKLN